MRHPVRRLPAFVLLTLLCAATDAGAASSEWWSSVQRSIGRMEYEARARSDQSFHAPNRAQGFGTSFTADGIAIVPRTEAASWEWRVRLAGADGVTPMANGTRVEYRHEEITEWFVNSERGLEHGFEIPRPTPRYVKDDELRVPLSVSGTLRGLQNGGAIDFVTDSGARAIRYDTLVVTDATGRTLPSRMQLCGSRVELIASVRGAVYPVTIDPLATSPSWSVQSNVPNANLGWIVAAAGDVNGDGFDDVLVGTPYYDGGQDGFVEGRVFLYNGSAAGPSLVHNWSVQGDQNNNATFASALASAGDVNGDGFDDIVIGSSDYTAGQINEGRAYVYYGSATGPSLTPNWMNEGNSSTAQFGASAAGAGDVNGDGFDDLIVGARSFTNGQFDEGRAYVYHGSSSGLSTTAAWMVESNLQFARFGSAVAGNLDFNGDGYDDVVVGAEEFANGQTSEGKIFLYYGSASGLPTAASSTAESNVVGAALGSALANAGDVNGDGLSDVIAGATNGPYIYLGSTLGFSAPAVTLTGAGDAIGGGGDVNGDGYSDVIVGNFGYSNGQTQEGVARVFYGRPAGPSTTADWTVEGNLASAYLGRSVAIAGDVNGDGFADVLIGAPGYTETIFEPGEGLAVLYNGGVGGPSLAASWTAEGNRAGERFGFSLSGAGDVNGDGYADVIVGVPQYGGGASRVGGVNITNGGSGYTSMPVLTLTGGGGTGAAGEARGSLESLTVTNGGSGYTETCFNVFDLASGGAAGSATATLSGGVVTSLTITDPGGGFFSGSQLKLAQCGGFGTGLTATATLVVSAVGLQSKGNGYTSAPAVSFSGGGGTGASGTAFLELVAQAGSSFVYHGSASGLSLTPNTVIDSTPGESQSGYSVAGAGDVNGDGYGDVVVGAPGRTQQSGLLDPPEPGLTGSEVDVSNHTARLFLGSPAGLVTENTPFLSGVSHPAGDLFQLGLSVAAAGDVDGDGYGDVIIGASGMGDGETAGHAILAYGPSFSTIRTNFWHVTGFFGMNMTVSGAGDLNGDGYADLAVGHEALTVDVYYGSAEGPPTTPSITFMLPGGVGSPGPTSGTAAGDVNGDGYGDLLVGSGGVAADTSGYAAIHYGSPTGISATANWSKTGQADSYFGHSVRAAGDVNGDGYADIIIGAPRHDNGQEDEGRAVIYYGSSTGPSLNPDWTAEADQILTDFGYPVAGAGDVNGDGRGDVVASARLYDNGETDEGRVYAYYGGAADPRWGPVQQLRGGSNTLIVAPGGMSYSSSEFRVRMNVLPTTRRWMRLELEVCPLGRAFNSDECSSELSAWTDVSSTIPGGTNLIVTAPKSPGSYRWRVRSQELPFTMPQPSPSQEGATGPWRRLLGQANEADISVKNAVAVGFAAAQTIVRESAGAVLPSLQVTTSDGQPTLEPIEIEFNLQQGTATVPDDFDGTPVTVTIPAGTAPGVVQPFSVPIVADAVDEPVEDFTVSFNAGAGWAGSVTFSVFIDDGAAYSIGDVTANEGLDGSTNFAFTVSKTGETILPANIGFSTSNGTATAGSDYTAATGNLMFTAVETSKSIIVAVTGDGLVEPDENFSITLTTTEGVLTDATATGTILNDDAIGPASTFVFTPAPANATGGVPFNVTIAARDAFTNTATGYRGTVHFTSSDGGATLPEDYTFTAGDAGVRTFSVTLNTAGNITLTVTDTVTSSITATTSIAVRGITGTTLMSSANPSTVGQSVTFTANVTSPSAGTITGTVTFKDGGDTIGTGTLGSPATFSTSALTQGAHSIRAFYEGDANFNASTSAPLTQNVNPTPFGAPLNFSATALNASQVSLSWNAVTGATGYEVWRSTVHPAFAFQIMTSNTVATDSGLSANTAYVYMVRALGSGDPSAFSAKDAATTVVFTDPDLTGATVKVEHFEELRTAVNAMRAAAGLGPIAALGITRNVTLIQAAHITSMRTGLTQARDTIGLPVLSFTDSTITPQVTVIKRLHVQEVRTGTQ